MSAGFGALEKPGYVRVISASAPAGEKRLLVQRHISVSATTSVPLLYADQNYAIQQIVLLPQTALAASGSNYYTLVFKKYEGDGTPGLGVPLDENTGSFSTEKRVLAVGRPVVLPQVGYISETLLKDTSLYAVCTLTGTATLDVLVQLMMSRRYISPTQSSMPGRGFLWIKTR